MVHTGTLRKYSYSIVKVKRCMNTSQGFVRVLFDIAIGLSRYTPIERTLDNLKQHPSHWWVVGSSCSEGLRFCSEHLTHISTVAVLVEQIECVGRLKGP